MAYSFDKNLHTYSSDLQFAKLEVEESFEKLSDQEKLYIYYLSHAAWTCSLVALMQTSTESPYIFMLAHKYIRAESLSTIKERAKENGFEEAEVNAWLMYIVAVFYNLGNYKACEKCKFVPNIPAKRLETLLSLSPIWEEQLKLLWSKVNEIMYDLSSNKMYLNFAPQGNSKYYENCDEEDFKKIMNWLKIKENFRCVKSRFGCRTQYEIKIASVDKMETLTEEIDNTLYMMSFGDYAPVLQRVTDYLKNAKSTAINETQSEILKNFISAIETGSMEKYRRCCELWVSNLQPEVEAWIGFMKTSRDPSGLSGEFQGFVGVYNHEGMDKYGDLFHKAREFFTLLPWSNAYECAEHLKPNFLSLNIITYCSSRLQPKLSIPDCEDGQSIGFKCFFFNNIYNAEHKEIRYPFLSEQDLQIIKKFDKQLYEVKMILHQMAHSSGKLLRDYDDDTTNYPRDLIDPLTEAPVQTFYKNDDKYRNKFHTISRQFEECRVEAIVLYLSLQDEVLKTFNVEEKDRSDFTYAFWLLLIYEGLTSLEIWNANTGWLEPYSQAKYALFSVLLEANIAKVVNAGDGLNIILDRCKALYQGKEVIGNFLLKLHIYRCTGNFEEAKKLFSSYLMVEGTEALEWFNIIIKRKKPEIFFVQPNVIIEGCRIVLKHYDTNMEGLLESWKERLDLIDELYAFLEQSTDVL